MKTKSKYSVHLVKDSFGPLHFYTKYPHRISTCKTCLPYVPTKEAVNLKESPTEEDKKYGLKYKDWHEIIKYYAEGLLLYLANGSVYRFSSGCGELQAIKYRLKDNTGRFNVDWGRTIKYHGEKLGITDIREIQKFLKEADNPKLFHYQHRETDHNKFLIRWTKRNYPFKFSRYWGVRLTSRSFKKLAYLMKDRPFTTYRIKDFV
jgi:hypothetical protein